MISDKIELASKEALDKIKKFRKNFTYNKVHFMTNDPEVKPNIDNIVSDVAKKYGLKVEFLKKILT